MSVALDERLPDGPQDAEITVRSSMLERSAQATITFPRSGSASRRARRGHRVRAICARLDGGVLSTTTRTGSRIGGTGGSAYVLRCAAGQALAGMSGRVGDWINQLSIRCRRVGTDGDLTGTTSTVGPAGGTGGSFAGTPTCSNNRPVVRLQGTYGWYVHSVTMTCRI